MSLDKEVTVKFWKSSDLDLDPNLEFFNGIVTIVPNRIYVVFHTPHPACACLLGNRLSIDGGLRSPAALVCLIVPFFCETSNGLLTVLCS